MVSIDVAREYDAYIELSNAASEASDFQSFVSNFFAAEYSLGRLAAAPGSDLVLAGLAGTDFEVQLRDLQLRHDQLFNVAIKKSYDRELEISSLMSSDLGRRACMDRWLQVVVASQALAPANYEYLKELFSNV